MNRRDQAVLALLILGAGALGAPVSQGIEAAQEGDCGYPTVDVLFDDPAELDMACRALADITEYFRGMGFEVTPRGSLRFADRLADRSDGDASTHGYFDRQRSRSVAYRASNVSPWGLIWTPQLAGSFLRHELAHMVVWQIVGGDPSRLRREWHEFIAYAVQLDLMEPRLREEVIAAQAQVRPFANLTEVNEFTSRMDPDVFAVAAYRTYLARGANTFVGQLLRGEVVPPPFSYPFPVLPSEVPSQ
ncbi:MAG: hypothetical protein RH942_00195 [Kiloniellaceae bacterium]